MMRCALPFLCSFRPSRNLGHVEASSTMNLLVPRSTPRRSLCSALRVADSCKLKQELLLLLKLQRTGTRELQNSSLDPCCSGPPASPRAVRAGITIFTDLRPQIIYLRQRHHSRDRPHTRTASAPHHASHVTSVQTTVRWRSVDVVCGQHTFLSNSISAHRTQAFNYNLFKLVINRVSPSVLPVLAVLGCVGAHVTHVARPAHQPLRGGVVGAQDAHKAEAAHKDHQP